MPHSKKEMIQHKLCFALMIFPTLVCTFSAFHFFLPVSMSLRLPQEDSFFPPDPFVLQAEANVKWWRENHRTLIHCSWYCIDQQAVFAGPAASDEELGNLIHATKRYPNRGALFGQAGNNQVFAPWRMENNKVISLERAPM